MISLKPIPKIIQQKMLDKMRALGKTGGNLGYEDYNAGAARTKLGQQFITPDMINSRSTFINMVSNQENPVILSGGELTYGITDSDGFGIKESRRIADGYDEIYGSRVTEKPGNYDDFEDFFNDNTKTANSSGRPMPGIKSIDVSFKGGARAHREATISWTCWSFEDVNRLMPHFLAHGKTVLIQWGWVYDKNSLLNLPTFIGKDGIKRKAFEDPSDEIIESGKGDFDMMVGRVKNFEFTTREDGGFDCSTVLTSVGVSLIENTIPDKEDEEDTVDYDMSSRESRKETLKKLRSIELKESNSEDTIESVDDVITLDSNVTLKYFLKSIDGYIIKQLAGAKTYVKTFRSHLAKHSKPYEFSNVSTNKGVDRVLKWSPGKYILIGHPGHLKFEATSTRLATASHDSRVPAGTATTNGAGNDGDLPFLEDVWVTWGWFEDNVLSKFVSLTSETSKQILNEFRSIEKTKKGSSKTHESVRIKNHKYLETIDLNTYILPGQFNPRSSLDNKPFGLGQTTNSDPYDNATANSDAEKFLKLAEVVNTNSADGFLPFSTNEVKLNLKADTTYDFKGEQGYLRHMLINTRVIKRAFGVNDDTLSAMTVQEGVQSMLSSLNDPINFWNLKIVADEQVPERIKIIDEGVPTFDFGKSVVKQSTKVDNTTGLIIGTESVFFFPVWSNNSIVKRQTINAKIPSSMQLAVMYGANMEQLKQFQNPGGAVSDKEGVAVSGLFNKNADKRQDGLDIAIRNNSSREIGNPNSHPWEKLALKGDGRSKDDLYMYIGNKGVAWKLRDRYRNRKTKIQSELLIGNELKYKEDVYNTLKVDKSLPLPPITFINPLQMEGLLLLADSDFVNRVKNFYSRTYDYNGRMKAENAAQIMHLTQKYGENKTSNNTLMIPLELELDVDGIGGIYPGNSYHSTYLPKEYQEKTLFQMFDVNHKVDSSGWTTSITGKMRTTLSSVFDRYKSSGAVGKRLFENLMSESAAIKELNKHNKLVSGNLNPVKDPTNSVTNSNTISLNGTSLTLNMEGGFTQTDATAQYEKGILNLSDDTDFLDEFYKADVKKKKK